jgi:hypothetical protein
MMKRSRTDELRSIVVRPRWNSAEARVVMETWARSGLSARAFGAKHGFDPQRLYWWSRRSRARTEGSATPVTFAEMRIGAATAEESCFEITVQHGRTVRVPQSFDADALRRLLAVLSDEGARC